jgi:hypothetical protein
MLKTVSPTQKTIHRRTAFLLGLVVTALGSAAYAEDPGTVCKREAGEDPYVCFDHAHKVWIQPLGEIKREGAPLKIVIINTAPDHIVATAQPIPEEKPKTQSEDGSCKLVSMVQTTFPKGEGRYALDIASDHKCEGLDDVKSSEFRVDVLGWEQAVAGGFIGSGHRNPQFSAYTRKVNNTDMTFVEEEPSDRRDDLRLGLSSFIHLYNERIDRWQDKGSGLRQLLPSGFSFGLGIGEQNRTMYSVGPAWRFGTKGFLSIGYSWAPVDRLPNGIRTCPRSSASCDATLAITDPSRIATLSQHTKGAWFASLSYTFLTLGTFFQDRFQEAIQATAKPGEAPKTAAEKKDPQLKMTCPQGPFNVGDPVTLKVTMQSASSPKAQLQLEFQIDPPKAEVLGTAWKKVDCPTGSKAQQCFELANPVIGGNGSSLIVKPQQAGSFKANLTVGDEAKASCDLVVQ